MKSLQGSLVTDFYIIYIVISETRMGTIVILLVGKKLIGMYTKCIRNNIL